MTSKVHQNYINGQWVDGYDVINNVNPSDISDTVGQYAKANADDCAAAVAAANVAFDSWSQSALEQRKAILDMIGSELISRSAEIGEILAREEGKTLAEGIGEVARAGQFFQYYGAEVLRLMGENTASVRPGVDVEVHREPLGVIGVVTPWNFPMAVAAWKVAPAIAYGNCVVLKPAELVPASAWLLSEVISRSGLPDGVFNLIMGAGSEVGEALCTSPNIQAVTFTGSVAVGKHIARNAIDNMARVQLEMGSKNALVILNDADMDTAVQCAVAGAYFGTGQKCTASSRIIVQSGIHDEFVTKMAEAMNSLVVGNALTPGVHIGAVVDGRQLEQNLNYMEIAKNEGAELLQGGDRLSLDSEGYFMSPALFINTTNDMQINREEVFGPIACVIKVDSYEEALEVSNDSDFGLTSGIITTSLAHASHFKRHSKSGCVMVNLPTAGTDYHVPFGGRKASSYGPREQGQYARDFYTIIKTNYSKPY
ncbi:aldehyde dehydrogenase family protein [Porticoccaceae bacterium]|nr:aldehyde dehydrogenase family protein [Porticoccaceae bacterium]MDA8651023.1 aldehyde dehydrogenase family protein [Porticoccaceae bacterium]MDA8681016.1 aldehyde dehydrogenase family protein [Porticoccaceae bacterium]MDB2634690.1 aldehyde dehydrogenase family protein [Porticoccaceae bacterium]MDB2664686.1 aldehyde dehydrogenase family protein [Porticoccaceae bacterium]